MSVTQIRETIRRYGQYAGVRHLKNRGVPLEDVVTALFGRVRRLS